jgi:hypothetical protein
MQIIGEVGTGRQVVAFWRPIQNVDRLAPTPQFCRIGIAHEPRMLQIENGKTAEGQAFRVSDRPIARFEKVLGWVGIWMSFRIPLIW